MTAAKKSAYICQWNVKVDGTAGLCGDEIQLTEEQAEKLGPAVLPKAVVEKQLEAQRALEEAEAAAMGGGDEAT